MASLRWSAVAPCTSRFGATSAVLDSPLRLRGPGVPHAHRAAASPAGGRSLLLPAKKEAAPTPAVISPASAVRMPGTSIFDPPAVVPPPLPDSNVCVSVTAAVAADRADGGDDESEPSSPGALGGEAAGGEPSVAPLGDEGVGDSWSSLVVGTGDGRVESFDDLKPPIRTKASRLIPTTIREAPPHTPGVIVLAGLALRRDRSRLRTATPAQNVRGRPRPSGGWGAPS